MKPKYKRFMVFEFDYYEPGGGLSHCIDSFHTEDAATERAFNSKEDDVEIFDRIAGVEIEWKPEPVKQADPREEMLKENRQKVLDTMEREKLDKLRMDVHFSGV